MSPLYRFCPQDPYLRHKVLRRLISKSRRETEGRSFKEDSCAPSPCVNRVIRKKDRLARQREEAEEVLEEAMARLRRIRKQERFLREKAAEMIARGVESLDELEEEERQEVEAAANALPTLALSSIDWGSLELPEEFILGSCPADTVQTAAGGLSSS
ncbi:hypothetical protein RJ55_02577 [Drechmeria coniospora]|nr:hypothetical protein RJ55_02577 [Drechmeria coniospora]